MNYPGIKDRMYGEWDVTTRRTIYLHGCAPTDHAVTLAVDAINPNLVAYIEEWEDTGWGYLRCELAWTGTVHAEEDTLWEVTTEIMGDDGLPAEGFTICEFNTQYVGYNADDYADM